MLRGGFLFSGGGGVELGLRGIVKPAFAVEYDPDIAAHYASVFGDHVIVADVRDVDYQAEARRVSLDYLHASPVCKNASVANAGASETEFDLTCAESIVRAIEAFGPKIFTLENVRGYAKFKSYQKILDALEVIGYHWRDSVEDAANYGVPQRRKRLLLRAWQHSGKVLPLAVPTHSKHGSLFTEPWRGWYGAVADLLPRCPPSKLANWQRKRLPADMSALFNGVPDSHGGECTPIGEGQDAPPLTASIEKHPMRAMLVGAGGYDGGVYHATGDRVSFAITANQNQDNQLLAMLCRVNGEGGELTVEPGQDAPAQTAAHSCDKQRVVLMGGANTSDTQGAAGVGVSEAGDPSTTVNTATSKGWRADPQRATVVALTPRCLARLQSVPDDYPLPENKRLAVTIIGNMVPPLLARIVFGALVSDYMDGRKNNEQ